MLQQLLYQKEYRGGKNKIKYLFYPNSGSDKLIIVFSSLTRKGVPARYNYIRTLRNIRVNKLFILDNLGPEGRGCYCLGKNNDYSIESDTKALIDKIKEKNNIIHTIYAGSSKGGYCALIFGLMDNDTHIVAGACQYLLGNYFLALPDIRLDTWVFGDNYSDEAVSELNDRLRKKIENAKKSRNVIHVHISDCEHTYEEHVKYLLNDLQKYGYTYDTDIKHYKDHGDIIKYFPEYLVNKVNDIFKTDENN